MLSSVLAVSMTLQTSSYRDRSPFLFFCLPLREETAGLAGDISSECTGLGLLTVAKLTKKENDESPP